MAAAAEAMRIRCNINVLLLRERNSAHTGASRRTAESARSLARGSCAPLTWIKPHVHLRAGAGPTASRRSVRTVPAGANVVAVGVVAAATVGPGRSGSNRSGAHRSRTDTVATIPAAIAVTSIASGYS